MHGGITPNLSYFDMYTKDAMQDIKNHIARYNKLVE